MLNELISHTKPLNIMYVLICVMVLNVDLQKKLYDFFNHLLLKLNDYDNKVFELNDEIKKTNDLILEINKISANEATLNAKLIASQNMLKNEQNTIKNNKIQYETDLKSRLLEGKYDYVEGHNLIEKAILNENFEEKEYKKIAGRTVPNHTFYFDLDPRIMINPKHDIILRDTVKRIIDTYIRDINSTESIVRGIMDFLLTEGYEYEGDQKNFDYAEFWEFPYEFIVLKRSDCEDFSIFCSNVLWLLGIPNCCVVGTYSNAGGHTWINYLDDNNKLKILECTAFAADQFIFDLTEEMKTKWYKSKCCFTFMKTYWLKSGV